MHPKWFLSQWHILRKSCTYLVPTLTPSTNGLKQDSRWPTSPRCSIGCVKNNFLSLCYVHTNCAAILHQDYHYLQTDRNELPVEPRNLGVPSGPSKMISELSYVWRKPCTYLASKWTEMRFHMIHVTEEFRQVRLKWFQAYRTIGTNHAPILRQD
jgi:hypothetical protein